MTKMKNFLLVGGQTAIADPELANATVLWVKRENDRYYANGTAANFEYVYDRSAGSVTFLNPPDGSGASDVESERVSVIYKY